MSAKLSVIFYIILCLEIGLVLTLLPWIPQGTLGLSDWGNNYFLLYAARKTGLHALQTVVASGWIRGAVTGVGLLNIGIAFWEIFHFKQTVRTLEQSPELQSSPKKPELQSSSKKPELQSSPKQDAALPYKVTKASNPATTPLSNHKRQDDRPDNAGN